jgi:hypothetical protein
MTNSWIVWDEFLNIYHTHLYITNLGEKSLIFKPSSGLSLWTFNENFDNKQVGGHTLYRIHKVHRSSGQEVPEGEQRNSSTLSLTSALDEVGSQPHDPAALPLTSHGKTRYPLYRRLGGPQGRSGRLRKTLPTPGFDPRRAQPVVSRYTDWAIPAHKNT